MKIGITERGDAALDLSWEKKLQNIDGAILITKNLNDNFIEAVMRNKDKVIVHITCTGYGGTVLEPNVPEYERTRLQLFKLLMEGFDRRRVVLRIDPIIPTERGIQTLEKVCNYFVDELSSSTFKRVIERVRISVLDMYPHVRQRFADAKLPLPYGDKFTASDEQFARVDEALGRMGHMRFESCAEPRLIHAKPIGCISVSDLRLLGLQVVGEQAMGGQRKDCLCVTCKTELLENKHPCKHNCMYCYWKG
jgi:hypothetical protein